MRKYKKIKKVLSIGLSLCVVVSMTAPLNVSAAAPNNRANLTYTNKDFSNGVHTTSNVTGKKLAVTNDGSEPLKENLKNTVLNKAVANGGADARTTFNLLGNTDIGKAVFNSSGTVTSNSSKANLDDVVVKAADSTVQVDTPVDNVTATKKADGATLKVKDDVSNLTVHAPNATSRVASNVSVDSVEVSETATASSVIVEKNATVTETTISAENTSLLSKPGSTMSNVTATEEAAGAKVEVRGKANSILTEAPSSSVVASKKAEVNSIKAEETATGATVSTSPKTTVGTATVSAPAATVEVSGTAKNVNATKTATGATVSIAQTATVDSTKNAAPDSTVSINGTVTNTTTTKNATGATTTIAQTAKVDKAKNAAPDSTVNISGSVTNVTNTKTATNATTTIEATAKTEKVASKAEGTTTVVHGEATTAEAGAANQTWIFSNTSKTENVTVSKDAEKASVTVSEGATVNSATVSSSNATVTLNNTVDKVTVTDTAANTTITGTGKVNNVEVNADGTQILAQVSTVNVAEDVSDAKVYDINLSSGTTSVEHSTDENGNTVISTATQATDGSKVDAVQTIVSTDEGYTATVETTKTDATGEVVEKSTTNVVDNGETKDLNTSTTNVATGETNTSSSTGSSTSGLINQVPIDQTPGTGTETPGTGTETPGTGTETPGTGTETPSTGGSSSSGGGGVSTPTYTVSYNTNGGTTANGAATISSQSVASGNSISAPESLTREGYTFVGWYSDPALTTPVSFPYTVGGTVTLYAGWISGSYETVPTPAASVQIGTNVAEFYVSLDAAVKATNDLTSDAAITLYTDAQVSDTVKFTNTDATITLNLGNYSIIGHDIGSNSPNTDNYKDAVVQIGNAVLRGQSTATPNNSKTAKVVINGSGSITRDDANGNVVTVFYGSDLTLDNGVTVQYTAGSDSEKKVAVAVYGDMRCSTDKSATAGNTTLTVNSATINNATYGIVPFGACTVTVNTGANISTSATNAAAIAGNGAYNVVIDGDYNADEAVAYNGTVINITGGTISGGSNSVGIYQPQDGTLTITGGTISGRAGLDIKAGTVNVSGSSTVITGTAVLDTDTVATVDNGNGGVSALKGAVTVIQKTGYSIESKDITVTITGGTITGGVLNVTKSPNLGHNYNVTYTGGTVTEIK